MTLIDKEGNNIPTYNHCRVRPGQPGWEVQHAGGLRKLQYNINTRYRSKRDLIDVKQLCIQVASGDVTWHGLAWCPQSAKYPDAEIFSVVHNGVTLVGFANPSCDMPISLFTLTAYVGFGDENPGDLITYYDLAVKRWRVPRSKELIEAYNDLGIDDTNPRCLFNLDQRIQ